MKIAVSSTTRIPSSAANSIQVLMACEGLKVCGNEIDLCVPGSGMPDFESIRPQYGLHCEAFPIVYLPSKAKLHRLDFAWAAFCRAKAIRADLVYTWTIQIAVLAAVNGMRTVFEVHDLPTGRGRFWFGLYTKLKTPKTCAVITQALLDRLLKLYPNLKESECVIAPNGCCPQDYESLPSIDDAKKALGFDPNRVLVSCSGHLYRGRGSELFLKLAEHFPQADFHWFGGTPEDTAHCRDLTYENDLRNARFHGFIPRGDLPLYQAASDILLMPYGANIAGSSGGNSADICSPMKMFDYMACGRAIMTSDLPVIREILDESCAVFCKPEDSESWIQALAPLLENSSRRAVLADAVRSRSSRYTWEKRAEKITAD